MNGLWISAGLLALIASVGWRILRGRAMKRLPASQAVPSQVAHYTRRALDSSDPESFIIFSSPKSAAFVQVYRGESGFRVSVPQFSDAQRARGDAIRSHFAALGLELDPDQQKPPRTWFEAILPADPSAAASVVSALAAKVCATTGALIVQWHGDGISEASLGPMRVPGPGSLIPPPRPGTGLRFTDFG
jgi:hypothetical protein